MILGYHPGRYLFESACVVTGHFCDMETLRNWSEVSMCTLYD